MTKAEIVRKVGLCMGILVLSLVLQMFHFWLGFRLVLLDSLSMDIIMMLRQALNVPYILLWIVVLPYCIYKWFNKPICNTAVLWFCFFLANAPVISVAYTDGWHIGFQFNLMQFVLGISGIVLDHTFVSGEPLANTHFGEFLNWDLLCVNVLIIMAYVVLLYLHRRKYGFKIKNM